MKKLILSVTALALLGTVGFLSMPATSFAKSSFVKNMMINWKKLWEGIKAVGDGIVTIIEAIAEGKAASGTGGSASVQVDMAAVDMEQLQNLGIRLHDNSIEFTRDAIAVSGPVNDLTILKGNYPLDDNGMARVNWLVTDKQH